MNTMSKKLDYKWIIVALCFLMILVTLGFCSSPKGLYLDKITTALGISRTEYSLNDSLRYIMTAVLNVFFGFLVGRFGMKKMILAGFASLTASQVVYSFATNVVGIYIGGTLLGIGFALTGTTMVGCVINRWCKESKGKIMGAILAANGLGGALAIQIITPILEKDVFGYRNAYRLAAVILLAVAVLIAVFFKENVPGAENGKVVVSKKKSRGRSWAGVDLKDAVKMPYFYVALVCIFFTGFVLQSVTGVTAAYLKKDIGIDPVYVGVVLSVHSVALAAAKFITGFVYDKFGLRVTISSCSFMAVLVMTLLMLITNTETGRTLAMIEGIVSSFALPLETIMLPIYAGDLFGQKSFEKILGIFSAVNVAGYAIGSPFMNACFDLSGSYKIGFVICGVIMLAVIVVLQFVINAAHKTQKRVEEASSVN